MLERESRGPPVGSYGSSIHIFLRSGAHHQLLPTGAHVTDGLHPGEYLHGRELHASCQQSRRLGISISRSADPWRWQEHGRDNSSRATVLDEYDVSCSPSSRVAQASNTRPILGYSPASLPCAHQARANRSTTICPSELARMGACVHAYGGVLPSG